MKDLVHIVQNSKKRSTCTEYHDSIFTHVVGSGFCQRRGVTLKGKVYSCLVGGHTWFASTHPHIDAGKTLVLLSYAPLLHSEVCTVQTGTSIFFVA